MVLTEDTGVKFLHQMMKKKKKKKKKMPKGMAIMTSEHRLFNLDLRSPLTRSAIVKISTKTLAKEVLAHANGGKKKLLRSTRLSRAALEELVDASVQRHIANEHAPAWDAARAHVGTSTSSTTALPPAALDARVRATSALLPQKTPASQYVPAVMCFPSSEGLDVSPHLPLPSPHASPSLSLFLSFSPSSPPPLLLRTIRLAAAGAAAKTQSSLSPPNYLMLLRRESTAVPAPEGLSVSSTARTEKDAVSTLMGLFDSHSPVVGKGRQRLTARLEPYNHSPERKGEEKKGGGKRKAKGKREKKKKKKQKHKRTE